MMARKPNHVLYQRVDGTTYLVEPTLAIPARYMCFKRLNMWRGVIAVTDEYKFKECYESDRDATREVVNYEVNMN